MNGASADPWVNTISMPRRISTNMMGPSQNFFRTRMNCHSSPKMENFARVPDRKLMDPPLRSPRRSDALEDTTLEQRVAKGSRRDPVPRGVPVAVVPEMQGLAGRMGAELRQEVQDREPALLRRQPHPLPQEGPFVRLG